MRDDWFSRLTGFNEGPYSTTRELLEVNGSTLRSKVNDRSFCIGQFEMPSLADLRLRVAQGTGASGPNRVSIVTGDVRKMHQMPEYAGALFQVASQFNALEMVGPSVTPEDGVTRYEHDRTQGPACAIAAGAATIYRNYFAPVGDQIGQSAANQLDGLADLGAELSRALGRPVNDLWSMQNGYALATRTGLEMIGAHLRETGDAAVNEIGLLGNLTEDVGGVAHVGGGELADSGLNVNLAELLELCIVRADLAQSLLEDGRVGGDANDVLVLDELLQGAGLDAGAGQVVQPDRDTGVRGALSCFSHCFSP